MLFARHIPAQRPPADDLTTRHCLAARLLSLLSPVFRTVKKGVAERTKKLPLTLLSSQRRTFTDATSPQRSSPDLLQRRSSAGCRGEARGQRAGSVTIPQYDAQCLRLNQQFRKSKARNSFRFTKLTLKMFSPSIQTVFSHRTAGCHAILSQAAKSKNMESPVKSRNFPTPVRKSLHARFGDAT